jgi:hypothetical protein
LSRDGFKDNLEFFGLEDRIKNGMVDERILILAE